MGHHLSLLFSAILSSSEKVLSLVDPDLSNSVTILAIIFVIRAFLEGLNRPFIIFTNMFQDSLSSLFLSFPRVAEIKTSLPALQSRYNTKQPITNPVLAFLTPSHTLPRPRFCLVQPNTREADSDLFLAELACRCAELPAAASTTDGLILATPSHSQPPLPPSDHYSSPLSGYTRRTIRGGGYGGRGRGEGRGGREEEEKKKRKKLSPKCMKYSETF